MSRNASQSQLDLIARLIGERVSTYTLPVPADLPMSVASSIIDDLFASPRVSSPAPADVSGATLAPEHTYRAPDGAVYRVVMSGSGNLYGKVWTASGVIDADGKHRGEFTYFPGIRRVTGLVEMTYAEVCAFGVLTGTCCVCCADLKDQVSVKLGIGPTCERNLTGKARSNGKAYRAAVLAS